MRFNEINKTNRLLSSPAVIADSQRSFLAGRLIRLLLLAAAVCSVWLTLENRWGANFHFPVRYTGDSCYILGMMKLVKDGDFGLFGHIYTKSLGAPFIGQLNDFPQTERFIIWLGGQVARGIGLIPASNAILLLSSIIAALSFYLAARLWRVSRLPSWIFAIVYAFLPQSQRSLDHLGIGFIGLLPLQFYCCWYIGTSYRMSWRAFRFKLTFVISLLSGLLNIYWVFFFIQMYAIALLYRLIRRKKNFSLSLIPLFSVGLVSVAFLLSFIIYRIEYGENTAALVRSYFDAERWSLKLIDLLIPNWGPYWGWTSAFFSRYYDGGRLEVGESWWGAYIGICAISGLLCLFFWGIQRQFNKRAFSIPCLTALWIILYTSVGGPHAIFCLILNFYDIRGINRYSEAIAAVGLLYFVFIISRLVRNWAFSSRLFFFVLLALLAIIDQSFKIYTFPFEYNRSIKERVVADQLLVSCLEGRLEKDAMLYLLPVIDFPEPFLGRGANKLGTSFYNSMRPFLYSSKLRYSYGSNKGREGADWQLDVQELPAGEMANVLESYGFSGILLNREGYEDRGEHLLAAFAEAGWPITFEEGIANEWVLISLHPAEKQVLPVSTPYAISANGQGS